MEEQTVEGGSRLDWLVAAQAELDHLEKHGTSQRLVTALFLGGGVLFSTGWIWEGWFSIPLGGFAILLATSVLLRDIQRSRKRKGLEAAIAAYDDDAIAEFDDHANQLGPPIQ